MEKKRSYAHLNKAWEKNRTYYTHNGIRDTRTGWTKRLGLSPTAFGNRLALFKAGKIDEAMLFRKEKTNKTHKKYELSIPREKYLAILANNLKNAHPNGKAPACVTMRIWKPLMDVLKPLKAKEAQKAVKEGRVAGLNYYSWNMFLIDSLNLKMPFKIPTRF